MNDLWRDLVEESGCPRMIGRQLQYPFGRLPGLVGLARSVIGASKLIDHLRALVVTGGFF